MNFMYYDEIMVVGSGKFAYECARIVTKMHTNVNVLEYKANQNISLLESLCRRNGISYREIDNDINALVKSDRRYLIISAFNTYIFKSTLVNMQDIDIINYHPSLLPKHPGRNAEAWAIFEGDKKTGITWHVVTEHIDQGDIIVQEEVEIDDFATSLSLMIEQNKKGIEVFKKIIPTILNGNMTISKQEIRKYTYHKSWEIPNRGYLEMYWEDSLKSQFLRSMDYGKLKILGNPKVRIDGKEYKWNGYRITEKNMPKVFNDCDFLIEGKEKDFVLENIQEI